jgi:hypothetical protein
MKNPTDLGYNIIRTLKERVGSQCGLCSSRDEQMWVKGLKSSHRQLSCSFTPLALFPQREKVLLHFSK